MAILRAIFTNLGWDVEPVLGRYSFLLLDQTPDLLWMSIIFSILMLLTSYVFGKKSQKTIKNIKEPSNITDYSKYLDEVENSEDLSLAQQNMISRLKIARQRALNKSIEEKLSPEERLQEKRIENEQMEKILSLLKENEGMSMEDLKDQMAMYKTN